MSPLFTRMALLLCLFTASLYGCGGDAGGGGGPGAAASPSPSARNGRTGGSIGSGSSTNRLTTGPTALPVVRPPAFDLESSLEQFFTRCQNEYLNSLRVRWVPEPTLTRVVPREEREDRAARQIEYRLTLQSNFVYFNSHSNTDLQGKYVRELTRCIARYDEDLPYLKYRTEIAIEEVPKPGTESASPSPSPSRASGSSR